MALPASFARDGFVDLHTLKGKYRRLMIGTDGPPNSGKTEFGLSAPGPGIVLCLDRGFDAMLDNANPPPTRQTNFSFKVVKSTSTTLQSEFMDDWKAFKDDFRKAMANPDARTVVIDGDSDSWEIQRFAAFGKLIQIPPLMYAEVNTTRRQLYRGAWDSGKIIIATNKVKRLYKTKYKSNGEPALDNSGKEIREWDNQSYTRQGFEDQEYLWQIQLRHMRRVTENGIEWGIKIMQCKVDQALDGMELWGDQCHFRGLVETVYPNVDPREWGFAS